MCRAPGVVRKNEPVTVTLEDGKTVRLSAVPHDFCPHCGERIYDPADLRRARRFRELKKAS